MRRALLTTSYPVHDALYAEFSRFGVSVNPTMFAGLNELLNNLGLTIRPQNMMMPHPTSHRNGGNNNNTKSGKTAKRRFQNQSASVVYNGAAQGLKAELIEHRTLPDGTECVYDGIHTKKWRLRNNGSKEWGYNIELVYFSGDQDIVLNKRVSVSNCQPGKMCDVQTSIKIPNKKGRYTAYYRLYNGNTPFGPKLWADIQATDKISRTKMKSVPEPSGFSSSMSSDDGYHRDFAPNSPISPQMNDNNDGTKAKGRRLSMVLSRNVPSISCICGEYLMATRPS